MNNDIQAARKLLTDLREAYQGLPQFMRERVAHMLRAIPLLESTRDEVAR